MTQLQKKNLATPIIIGLLVLSVAMAVIVAIAQNGKISALDEKLGTLVDEQKKAAEPPPAPAPEPAAPASLATAIALLPKPETGRSGRRVTDDVYWVWAQAPGEAVGSGDQPALNAEDQIWLVNVTTKAATMIRSWKFGVPQGATVSDAPVTGKYAQVKVVAGWEGVNTEVNLYIDAQSGEFAFSTQLENGRVATIEKGDKKLVIQMEPIDACKANEQPPAKKVTATGLNVNGTAVPFAKPQQVTCQPNELLGAGFYPPFQYFTFSEDLSVFRIGLWDTLVAEVPLADIDPAKLVYLDPNKRP